MDKLLYEIAARNNVQVGEVCEGRGEAEGGVKLVNLVNELNFLKQHLIGP